MMANDPDLETDLKILRKLTKTVGLGVQTDLLRTFYDVDEVNAQIGDEYLIVKRQDAQRKQTRKIIHD